MLAETTAREVGHVDLREALELAALIARHDPRVRGRRASARWLRRWLEERPRATIDEAVMIAGLLAALGGADAEADGRPTREELHATAADQFTWVGQWDCPGGVPSIESALRPWLR